MLRHITDEKPVTARTFIISLTNIGQARPEFITTILSTLKNADLSRYARSMRPLLEGDIKNAVGILEPISDIKR